jgi:hypothetical protein
MPAAQRISHGRRISILAEDAMQRASILPTRYQEPPWNLCCSKGAISARRTLKPYSKCVLAALGSSRSRSSRSRIFSSACSSYHLSRTFIW